MAGFENKYPYTDFHELNLDWFLTRFHSLLQEWADLAADNAEFKQTMTERFNTLDHTVQEFIQFVNNYFDNLDVQKEINNKLNDMAADGTLSALIQPLFDEYKTEIDNEVSVQNGRIYVLESRMDSFTHLTEGSTTGDAELADIRIGANSITYSTAGDAVRDQFETTNTTHVKEFENLFNPNDSDIEHGGYYNILHTWVTANNFSVSGYIPCIPDFEYRSSQWPEGQSTGLIVTFYDSSKNFVSGINNFTKCVVPSGCGFLRFTYQTNTEKDLSFTLGHNTPDYRLPYNEKDHIITRNIKSSEFTSSVFGTTSDEIETYDNTARGVLVNDGTIATTGFSNIVINKYKVDNYSAVLFSGTSTLTIGHGFCDLWLVDDNGDMVDYAEPYSNSYVYDSRYINIPSGVKEIWTTTAVFTIYGLCVRDALSRNKISNIEQQISTGLVVGSQWLNKVWYAYGTSITSVHQGTGKYPTYLAAMSGMQLNEKGIGGGGIGNLGAYSTGQVYSAICNTTDGKLDADIITLEQGANDVTKDVPLGSIYDTGTSSLSGCLNDCIRYLQEKTTAQIVITPSPDARFADPDDWVAYQRWTLLMEEICDINRVPFIKSNTNMGYGKLHSNQRSLYIVDNIHQTDLGGYVMAESIWYQLRNIPLFRTSIPT